MLNKKRLIMCEIYNLTLLREPLCPNMQPNSSLHMDEPRWYPPKGVQAITYHIKTVNILYLI